MKDTCKSADIHAGVKLVWSLHDNYWRVWKLFRVPSVIHLFFLWEIVNASILWLLSDKSSTLIAMFMGPTCGPSGAFYILWLNQILEICLASLRAADWAGHRISWGKRGCLLVGWMGWANKEGWAFGSCGAIRLVTGRNGHKQRPQAETATNRKGKNPNGQKPERPQTETVTDWNGHKPKRPQTETAKNQNGHKQERPHWTKSQYIAKHMYDLWATEYVCK